MKNVIASIVLSIVSFAAVAKTPEEQILLCNGIAETGQKVMEARQHNIPKTKVKRRLSATLDRNRTASLDMKRSIKSIAMDIIESAYREPLHSTEEAQDKTVRLFKDKIYKLCMSGNMKP